VPIEQQNAERKPGAPQEHPRPRPDGPSTPLVPPAERFSREDPTAGAANPVEPVEDAARPRGEVPQGAEEADVLVDIPRLQVQELALELEASRVLNRIRLDVKDLELGLLLKADLDQLVELADRREHDEPHHRRGVVRQGGRLTSAAYERLFGGGGRPQLGSGDDDEPVEAEQARTQGEQARTQGEQPGPQGEQPRPHGEQRHGRSDDDERARDGAPSRAARIAREGGKAVTVAAAGLAGGALLRPKIEPLRKRVPELPAPLRRESAPKAAFRRLVRALPG
jgi:hypothetical protein